MSTILIIFAIIFFNGKMTYPDGEDVYYEYNLGGMLEKVYGEKDGASCRYINSIAYNEFELKSFVKYGNGMYTRYSYDSLQRLSNLKCRSPRNAAFFYRTQSLYHGLF